MSRSLVLAALGCSCWSPSGTYAVTVTSCSHYKTVALSFDGDTVVVEKPFTETTGNMDPAMNVEIDDHHVTFDLTYFLLVGDTDYTENGQESYALDVDDAHLSGTGSGAYHGSALEIPYDCSGAFTVNGDKMMGSGN